MSPRLKNIYTKLEKAGLDALIVNLASNISYLTDFTSRDAYLIVSRKENIYLTDSRYIEEVKAKLDKQFRLQKINGSTFKLIADACRSLRLKRVGFEERYLAFAEYQKIKEEAGRKIDLVPTHDIVEGLRQLKSAHELEKLKKAVQITVSAFNFIRDLLVPGKKEIEIVAELERFLRYKGARATAFEIIVASGPHSSFPHHQSGERRLKQNEPVLIDLGVDYLGYKSDLTRVFFLGKITSLYRSIYDIVLAAQEAAISKIKPAVRIAEIDKVARQHIIRAGYGKFFVHNLGHGIGLEVHESPHIRSKEEAKLEAGMVVTIEPGIYLPGKFGVRLEDMVLVTGKGAGLISGALDK